MDDRYCCMCDSVIVAVTGPIRRDLQTSRKEDATPFRGCIEAVSFRYCNTQFDAAIKYRRNVCIMTAHFSYTETNGGLMSGDLFTPH
jgi:hypothetical protein